MNASRCYGYADVGRFGLGHGLLAWARCVVWCHDHGAQMLAPRWLRLRIGPWLRGERDKRFYAKLFARGHQIGAWRRTWLLATCRRVAVADWHSSGNGVLPDRTVVVFANRVSGNEAAHFHEIVGRQQLVRAQLLAMTRARFLPEPVGYPHVAIHVRGGDFGRPASLNTLHQGTHNQRLPVDWFVDMLRGMRQRLAVDVPAVVYSDCSDQEIGSLLEMPRVVRSRHRESVSDMLAMSAANLQISSGSGFSRWGSYLGNVPRICFPGQRHVRVLARQAADGLDCEPEAMNADELTAAFIDHVRLKLTHAPAYNEV